MLWKQQCVLNPLIESIYKKLNYKHIISEVKKEFESTYSFVQTGIANSAIKKHVDSFNAFIALKNKKVDGEYNRCLNEPQKQMMTCLHNIIISKGFYYFF